MWNERLEAAAAEMRVRFATQLELELRTAQMSSELASRAEVATRKSRSATRVIATEDAEILRRHGIHTSRAAKELRWSPKRVQSACVALGIFDQATLTARRGRKGRPRGPSPGNRPSDERVEKYPMTAEIDEILRTASGSIAEAMRRTAYPRSIIRKRMIELELVRTDSAGRVSARSFHEIPDVDAIMRAFPGKHAKVAVLTGWSRHSVMWRMRQLGLSDPARRRDDEAQIVALLEEHGGSLVDVVRALRNGSQPRSEKYIAAIRRKYSVPRTKPRSRPIRRDLTPGIDRYIESLLGLSAQKRAEYFRFLSLSLPPQLSAELAAAILSLSRRTINNYVNQGWFPHAKRDFINFIINQCEYSMSEMRQKERAASVAA